MRAHDGGICHDVIIVGIGRQCLESALPDATLAPAGVASIDGRKIPKSLW